MLKALSRPSSSMPMTAYVHDWLRQLGEGTGECDLPGTPFTLVWTWGEYTHCTCTMRAPHQVFDELIFTRGGSNDSFWYATPIPVRVHDKQPLRQP